MFLGQEIKVLGDWFIIHFTENNGMAFGMEFAGDYGKLVLSLFRLIAIVFIGIYLYRLSQKNSHKWLIISVSLILAGAIGNLLDSAFYGMIFSESSYFHIASIFPQGGGYGSFLHGKVVDMWYFPIIRGTYPEWLPFVGARDFLFFRPVFNIADSSISIGVFLLIIFQRRFFHKSAH